MHPAACFGTEEGWALSLWITNVYKFHFYQSKLAGRAAFPHSLPPQGDLRAVHVLERVFFVT